MRCFLVLAVHITLHGVESSQDRRKIVRNRFCRHLDECWVWLEQRGMIWRGRYQPSKARTKQIDVTIRLRMKLVVCNIIGVR